MLINLLKGGTRQPWQRQLPCEVIEDYMTVSLKFKLGAGLETRIDLRTEKLSGRECYQGSTCLLEHTPGVVTRALLEHDH